MRPLRSLLLYMAAILLGAALVAPWLYWLAQWAGSHSSIFTRLSTQPFHRYIDRALLGLALLGLWPFLRSIGVDSWAAVGLVKPSGNWGRLAAGFALGFASLAGVALLAFAGGVRTLKADTTASEVFGKLLSAGLTAAVVALLEELLFRGALFGALRKVHRWTTALLVSSGVYALVHFFQKPAEPAQVIWSSGVEMLPRMLRGFLEIEMLVPAFFNLFLAGMILALAYERTGNLYLSIGLHAGWIFWLKFYGAVTVAAAQASAIPWLWGSGKLIDGWLALALLLPMLMALWHFPLKKYTLARVS